MAETPRLGSVFFCITLPPSRDDPEAAETEIVECTEGREIARSAVCEGDGHTQVSRARERQLYCPCGRWHRSFDRGARSKHEGRSLSVQESNYLHVRFEIPYVRTITTCPLAQRAARRLP